MNIFEQLDVNVYEALFKTITPINTSIMIGITFFASAEVLITIAIILLLIFKNKRNSKYVTLNLILSFILNRVIKAIVRRPRPEAFALVIENGYSFPSAHSMVGFAFYGFIIYLMLKSNKGRRPKIIYTSLLSLLVVLIGISRVYLGVHYITDVLGGFLIALLYLILFIKFIYKRNIFKMNK